MRELIPGSLLAYCSVPIHPPLAIFAGNENYDSHQSCGNINPNNISPPRASDYIDFTAGVVSALKDANIPLAAPLEAWDWHAGGWNEKLITAKTTAGSPLYDGFVMHPCVPMLTPQTLASAVPSRAKSAATESNLKSILARLLCK